MATEFEKLMGDFQAKLKPISAQDIAMAKGETMETAPPAEAPAPTPAPSPEGQPCVRIEFRKLIQSLTADFIGHPGEVKELVVGLVEGMPQCKE